MALSERARLGPALALATSVGDKAAATSRTMPAMEGGVVDPSVRMYQWRRCHERPVSARNDRVITVTFASLGPQIAPGMRSRKFRTV